MQRIIFVCAVMVIAGYFNAALEGKEYRSFTEDRQVLERYVEDADDAQTREQWDRATTSAMEEMRADWEVDAEAALRGALLKAQGDAQAEEEARNGYELAKAAWENEADAYLESERGQWYARRLYSVTGSIDEAQRAFLSGELKKITNSAKNGEKTVQAWDAGYEELSTEIIAQWERNVRSERERLFGEGGSLGAGEKETYEATLFTLEKESIARLRNESNTLVYRERNKYISDILFDTNSLRYESEQGSASAISEKILEDTNKVLDEASDKIGTYDTAVPEGASPLEIKELGNAWEKEIKALLEKGLLQWQDAQDALMKKYLGWRNTSKESFEAGEAEWADAFDSLAQARKQWQSKVNTQIDKGLSEWKAKESELENNIETMRDSLDGYMKVLDGQWDDHAKDMYDMALSSGKTMRQATESIAYYTDICNKIKSASSGSVRYWDQCLYNNTGGYGFTITNDKTKWTLVKGTGTRSDEAWSAAYGDLSPLRGLFSRAYITPSKIYDDSIGAQPNDQYEIKMTYAGMTPGGTVDSPWVDERYTVAIAQYVYIQDYDDYKTVPNPLYGETNQPQTIQVPNYVWVRKLKGTQNVTWTIRTTDASEKKSAYASYYFEKVRWERIRNSFNSVAEWTEHQIYGVDMAGEDNGAGYIDNNGQEGDPYLMSDAEFSWKISQRERNFRQERLDIAIEVLKYANPNDYREKIASLAESAKAQIQMNKEAILALDTKIASESDPILKGQRQREKTSLEEENLYLASLESYYAEKSASEGNQYLAGGKRESKEATEVRVQTTKDAANAAQAEYEAALASVNEQIAQMERIKSGPESDSLDALSADIEQKMKDLDAKRKAYDECAQALIVLENSEGKEFIIDQIKGLQDALVNAYGELPEKRTTYYTKARQAEHAAEASLFTEAYLSTIQRKEKAEAAFAAMSESVKGSETESNLNAWMSSLEGKKDSIWTDEEDATWNTLSGKYNEYLNESDPTNKAKQMDELFALVRQSYMICIAKRDAAKDSLALLASGNYERSELGGDTRKENREAGIYADYVTMEKDALTRVKAAMGEINDESKRTYAELIKNLKNEAGAYTYGENKDATVARVAYEWAKAMLGDVNAGNWNNYSDDLGALISRADKLSSVYDGSINVEACIAVADGDGSANEVADAKAMMRELTAHGSSLQCLSFITMYDGRLQSAEYSIMDEQDLAENYYRALGSAEGGKEKYAGEIEEFVQGLVGGFSFAGLMGLSNAGDDDARYGKIYEIARALQSYASTGAHLPSTVQEMIATIGSLADEYDGYRYVNEHRGKDIAEAESDLADAKKTSQAVTQVSSFVSNVIDSLFSSEVVLDEHGRLALILQELNSAQMSESMNLVKSIMGSGSAAVLEGMDNLTKVWDEFTGILENMSGVYARMEKEKLLAAYDGMSDPAAYVEENAKLVSAAQKKDIISYIASFREKKAYDTFVSETGLTGTLLDWITQRKENDPSSEVYDDDAFHAEMEKYILIQGYRALQGAPGVTYANAPEEFKNYKRMSAFELFIADPTIWSGIQSSYEASGLSIEEYAAKQFISMGGAYADADAEDEYADFATDYIKGGADARAYLPEELWSYAAADEYYEGVFTPGGSLSGDALSGYVENTFKDASFAGAVRSDLFAYARRLDLVDDYYGGDISSYLKNKNKESTLTKEDMEYVRVWYYAQGTEFDVLWPGYHTGLGSLNANVAAGQAYASGMLSEYLSGESLGTGLIMNVMDTLNRNSSRDEKRKQMLCDFIADPASFRDFRNLLTDTAAEDEDGHAELTVVTATPASIGDLLDTNDGKQIIKESDDDITNRMTERAFQMASMIRDLGVISGANNEEFTSNDVATIAKVREELKGKTAADVSAYYDVVSGDADSMSVYAQEAYGEYMLEYGAYTGKIAEIQEQGAVLAIFTGSGGDKKTQLANLDRLKNELESANTAYHAAQDALSTRQEAYDTAASEYGDRMYASSQAYNAYRNAEKRYESAWAVWEYASTPYLVQDSVQGSQPENGTLPEGEYVDLSGIDRPDAYDRAKQCANAYGAAYVSSRIKEKAYQNRETEEKLRADAAYKAERERVTRQAESYIRISRASNILDDTINKLKMAESTAKQAYEKALGKFNDSTWEKGDEAEAALEETISYLLRGVTTPSGAVSAIEKLRVMVTTHGFAEWIGDTSYEKMAPHDDDGRFRKRAIKTINEEWPSYASYRAGNELIGKAMDLCIANADADFGHDGNIWEKTYNYFYWQEAYEYFDKKVADTSGKRHHKRKQNYKDHRNNAENKRNTYSGWLGLNNNSGKWDTLATQLWNIATTQKKYREATAKLENLTRKGSIDDLKALLQSDAYGLTEEDMKHVYDSVTGDVLTGDEEKLNIEGKRDNAVVLDENGDGVTYVKKGDIYELYTKYGEKIGERTASANPDYLYENDNTVRRNSYNAKDTLSFIHTTLLARLGESIASLEAEGNKHDAAASLMDREKLYWELLGYAGGDREVSELNQKNVDGTKAERGYDGYEKMLGKLLQGDESSGSIIVKNIIEQTKAFAEQDWAQRKEALDDRAHRWMELTGYVKARGDADWDSKMREMIMLKNRWEYDTLNAIDKGEAQWGAQMRTNRDNMETWRLAANEAVTKGATQGLYEELSKKLQVYAANMGSTEIQGVQLLPNTKDIMARVLAKTPIDDLGALNKSMSQASTVAGIGMMIKIGSYGATTSDYKESLEQYEQAMDRLQSAQMSEALKEMSVQLNENLDEANENAYNSIETDIVAQMGGSGIWHRTSTDWKRPGMWEIEYCVSAPLFGSPKYKTYRVKDMQAYTTRALMVSPVKGIGGKSVNLSDVDSYATMGAAEIKMMVNVEQARLQKTMSEIFDPTNTNGFQFWVNKEVMRMTGSKPEEKKDTVTITDEDGVETEKAKTTSAVYNDTGESSDKHTLSTGYSKYMAGEALLGAGWYAKPVWGGGPNALELNKTVAMAIASIWGPAAAAVVGATLSVVNAAILVADGTMTWQQGVKSGGVNAVASVAGAYAGGIASGAGSGVTMTASQMATQSAVSTAVSGTIQNLGNCITWSADGGWGFDKGALTDKNAWGSLAINVAVAYVGGRLSSSGTPGQYATTATNVGNAFTSAAIRGAVSTTGNMAINRFFTDDKRSYGDILKEGVVSTTSSAATGMAQAGITSYLTDNGNTTGPKWWNQSSQEVFTTMTSNLTTQAIYKGLNNLTGDSFGAEPQLNWDVDAYGIVGNMAAEEWNKRTQKPVDPKKDPMQDKQTQTDGAAVGTREQERLREEIENAIRNGTAMNDYSDNGFSSEDIELYKEYYGGEAVNAGYGTSLSATSMDKQDMWMAMMADETIRQQMANDIENAKTTIEATNEVANSVRSEAEVARVRLMDEDKALQDAAWNKIVEERSKKGIIVEEVQGDELKKRFVAREFFGEGRDSETGLVKRDSLEMFIKMLNGGHDVNMSEGFNCVTIRNFYDYDSRVTDENRESKNAYMTAANGADQFRDAFFVIDNGQVQKMDSRTADSHATKNPNHDPHDNAGNDLLPGEYLIGRPDDYGSSKGRAVFIYSTEVQKQNQDTIVPSTRNTQAGLMLHLGPNEDGASWNYSWGCHVNQALNEYANQAYPTIDNWRQADTQKYYLVDTKTSNGYTTVAQRGWDYYLRNLLRKK
jgi:hypothetical protein